MLQNAANYLVQAAVATLLQLLTVLGPALGLGFVLDALSKFIRRRAARLVGVNAYTYLTAPGVVIHELGHALFCPIFGHRIARMQLFSPRADGTLGAVEHSYNPRSVYQRIGNFFIGAGPIWFGVLIVNLLTRGLIAYSSAHTHTADDPTVRAAASPDFEAIIKSVIGLVGLILQPRTLSSWPFWVFLYLIFCIASHITLSRPDLRGALSGFWTLLAVLLLFNLATHWFLADATQSLQSWLVRQSIVFYVAAGLVICLNLMLALILFLLTGAVAR